MRLIVISGRSGSGKTIVLHALEDLGFYCVDNLPVALLPDLSEHLGTAHKDIAVSIDARNMSGDLLNFKESLANIKHSGQCEIIYLDAEEDVLLKRFSETRRKHPLTSETVSLREAIRKEHLLLAPIASLAALIIDTSTLNHSALQALVRNRIAERKKGQMQLLLQSFGFKFGLPSDADFVFDVRCLPNPYWIPSLRPLSGRDQPVGSFLEAQPQVPAMLAHISDFLLQWLPRFENDHRSYLTVAIGCTGGQHRSVYLVEALVQRLQSKISNLQIRHRDLPEAGSRILIPHKVP